jgi:cellulose synthase/poly-beta-1,6-N-acetylglucosamine synthase-like glycosyltransferase
MSTQFLKFIQASRIPPLRSVKRPAPCLPARPSPLGAYLLDEKAISPGNLAKALALQLREDARLGDILIANGWVTERDLMKALSSQYGIGFADTAMPPHDVDMIRSVPWQLCLEHTVVPWSRSGGMLVMATSNPDKMAQIRAALPSDLGTVLFTLAPEVDVMKAIALGHGKALARRAEAEVPERMSCRNWNSSLSGLLVPVVFGILVLQLLFATTATLAVLSVLACALLTCNVLFKGTALWFHISKDKSGFNSHRQHGAQTKLPIISLFVPLFKEPKITGPLVQRMARLDYPRELLDICLIVEEHDTETRMALARADIPSWFRVIVVPDGTPRTKPRAMNYALNFARGSIVGVYDAEDAPEARQLHAVANRFAVAPKQVVCLQGRLDYYNPRQNWVSRCFTIEYATWFRLFLPAIKRMGLAVPLGGTTLFFRRDVLRELGGWDAHNVTEDADLGIRVARLGYETEMLDVTTLEEANAATWPWIKQRSRWNKGYFMTWVVHNRQPLQLLRDLGLRKWLGFHMMFLGTVLNAVLAPLLWSTIVVAFGMGHPIMTMLPQWAVWPMATIFTLATILTVTLAVVACQATHLRFLRPWVPLTLLYYQLTTLSTLKALFETIGQPFYWDKTEHGAFGGVDHDVVPAGIPKMDRKSIILGTPLKDTVPNIKALPEQLAKVPVVKIEKDGSIRRIS